LSETFARFGVLQVLVSDNAKIFSAKEMTICLKNNGVTQKFIPPYHQVSNGQVGRFVQTIKTSLYKQLITCKGIHRALHSFLLKFKRTNSTMFGRTIQSRIDLMSEKHEL